MSVTLAPGATQQLAYKLLGPLFGIGSPSWSSSNTSVATVNSVGTVTAVAVGTATITATLNGITGTTTVTVSTSGVQDGSFTDVQTSVNNDHLISAWEFPPSAVTLDGGGFVSSVIDIRGGTSHQPLTGFIVSAGNKPSYDAVNGRVTTNGGQNYLQTAFDPGYNLGATKTIVGICTSNPGPSDFTFCIEGNGDSAPVLGLAGDAGGKGIVGVAGNGGVVPTGKGYPAVPGVIGLHIVTGAPALGVGTTLSYPLFTYERPGRTRVVQNISSALQATGNCAVTVGGWRNSVGLTGDAATYCAIYVLDCIPTLAMVQAFQRRCVALGGTLA